MAFFVRRLVPLVFLALLWVPAAYAWSWPVQGPVLQQFSFDPAEPYAAGQHRGVDIGSPADASVLAPAAGSVTFAGTVPTSGRSVTIATSDGYSVTLTHLGTILVSRGATVAEGEAVGTVGPSGTPEVDVPYVHLGIRLASDPDGYLDPLPLLPPIAPSAPPEVSDAPAPAGSSAPPAQTTPAPATPAAAPEEPAAVPAGPAAAVPSSAPAPAAHVPASAPAPVAPASVRATAAAPATPATPLVREQPTPATPQRRPAPVSTHVPVRQRPALDHPGRRADAGRRPRPVAEEPAPLRHRPVPTPAPVRERPAAAEPRFPAVPLARGAGITLLVLVALAGVVLRRRRPAAPSEAAAVVIPLPRRYARIEERRVA